MIYSGFTSNTLKCLKTRPDPVRLTYAIQMTGSLMFYDRECDFSAMKAHKVQSYHHWQKSFSTRCFSGKVACGLHHMVRSRSEPPGNTILSTHFSYDEFRYCFLFMYARYGIEPIKSGFRIRIRIRIRIRMDPH